MDQLRAQNPYLVCGVPVTDAAPAEGQLGEHTVRALPATWPGLPSLRQLGRSIESGIRRLADRVVALVAPERSHYAQAQVRSGLQATDVAVERLVSAVNRSSDPAEFDRQVQDALAAVETVAARTCRRSASPVEASRAVIRARLALRLSSLDLRKLSELSSKLKGSAGFFQPTPLMLSLFRDAVKTAKDERTRSATASALGAVRADVGALLGEHGASLLAGHADSGQAKALMDGLYLKAARRLDDLQLPTDRATRRVFVMAAIHAHLAEQPGEDVLNAYGGWFRQLPGIEQRDLRAACQSVAGISFDCQLAQETLDTQIDQRHQDLADRVRQAADEVLQAQASGNGRFARLALSVLSAQEDLVDHERLLGLANAVAGPHRWDEVRGHTLNGLSVAPLDELDDGELGQLRRALQRHGEAVPSVEEAVRVREAAVAERHHLALRALASALVNGNRTAGLLDALASVRRVSDDALALRQRLGQRVPREQQDGFRSELLKKAVAQWDAPMRDGVRAELAKPEFRTIFSALHGSYLPGNDQPTQRCAEFVEQLCVALQVERSVPAASAVPADVDHALGEAFRETFGPSTQLCFAASRHLEGGALDSIVAELGRPLKQPLHASEVDSLISDGMQKDLNRANYFLDAGLGAGPVHLSWPDSSDGVDDRIRNAVTAFHEACGRDNAALWRLSQHMFQVSALVAEPLQHSRHNPFTVSTAPTADAVEHLPVKPAGGALSLGYVAEPHPDGSWSLQVDYRTQPVMALALDGAGRFRSDFDPIALDPVRSVMRFGMTLRVSPEGVATLAGPVRCTFALQPSDPGAVVPRT